MSDIDYKKWMVLQKTGPTDQCWKCTSSVSDSENEAETDAGLLAKEEGTPAAVVRVVSIFEPAFIKKSVE